MTPGQVPNIPFPGSKALLAPEILGLAPKHGRKFVDLLAGRGSLTFNADDLGFDYRHWYLNGIQTAPFLLAVKNHGRRFQAAEFSAAEYDRCAELAKHGDP